MEEQIQAQAQAQEKPPRHWNITIWLVIGGFFGIGMFLLIAGAGLQTSAVFSILVPPFLGFLEPQITDSVQDILPKREHLPPFLQRKLPHFTEEEREALPSAALPTNRDLQEETRVDIATFADTGDDLERYRGSSLYTFSQVMKSFTPSLEQIYLSTLLDGSLIYSDARGLCHVAVAGSTGQGKSSIVRLLMSQLCAAGASVLLLNPHYTRYDIENDEDWTPFEPYLLHDPMECRKYEVIEYYLTQVATILLPKRLEKFAHSQPVGKPYFLVLEELPAIIAHVPDAPRYIAEILREGRKVGIFLITASQDFLVRTIAPQGGGAIRDCYRTAFYVGGDPTTAKVLLDIPAAQIQENRLGKGTIMLRSKTCKQAVLVRVPYVDNQALYALLGPSTYHPEESSHDEILLEEIPMKSLDTSTLAPSYVLPPLPMKSQEVVKPSASVVPATKVLTQTLTPGRGVTKLTPELQMVLSVYKPGMSHRDIERELLKQGHKVSHVTAGQRLQRLKDLHIIDINGNLLVNR